MEALITTLLILFVINAINKKYTQTNNDTNKTQNKKSFAQQLSNTIEQIDKKQGKDGDFLGTATKGAWHR